MGFIHIILSVEKCNKVQSRDEQLRLKRAVDIAASVKCIRKSASHEIAMPRQLMTKIIFLLKWWCCKVLTWIGALFFVLHWDGNIENVFTSDLQLIIQWPHTETFCLAAETKWSCQPGSVTACFLCLCMKGYWASFCYSQDTVTSEIGWKAIDVSEYPTPHKSLLGSDALRSVYSWGHSNMKTLTKLLFQNTPSILPSLPSSIPLFRFFGTG